MIYIFIWAVEGYRPGFLVFSFTLISRHTLYQ
jgi:hypothetical protein